MSEIIEFMTTSSRNIVRAFNRRCLKKLWGYDMSEIKPALSPEEWTDFLAHRNGFWGWFTERYGAAGPGETELTLAARALYGQPFGFTWDDVSMLEDLDRPDLASRIAALLPPKRG